MIIQPVRMVTAFLKDATNGVNAQLNALASAGLYGSDGQPPDVAFIGDSVDDPVVIQGKEPHSLPAIYVKLDGPASFDGMIGTDRRIGDKVALAIRYLTHHGDPEEAVKDTGHTLRAIVKSLNVLHSNAQEAARTSNGIYLVACTLLLAGEWSEAVGNAKVTGAVVVHYEVRDLNP